MKKIIPILCTLIAIVSGVVYWHMHGPTPTPEAKAPDASPVASNAKTREPEERNKAVLKLIASTDRHEQRELAKELGDQAIAGTLELSTADRKAIRNYVSKTLELATSKEGNDRYEARAQFARLWYLANPGLIPHISGGNIKKAEMAAKAIILARNEETIKYMIAHTKTVNDPEKRAMCIFVLEMMTEQRTTLIEDRKCMSPEKSKELFDRVVAPALKELKPAGS